VDECKPLPIGRGEFLGAMFIALPRVVMKGFGRVAGCCVVFTAGAYTRSLLSST